MCEPRFVAQASACVTSLFGCPILSVVCEGWGLCFWPLSIAKAPRACHPESPDSWGVRDLLFAFCGSRFVVAQAYLCVPQALPCVLAFVGAMLTPLASLRFRRGGVNPRPSACPECLAEGRKAPEFSSSCNSRPVAAIPAVTYVRFSRFQAHAALSRAQSS